MKLTPKLTLLFLSVLLWEFAIASPEWHTARDGHSYLIEKELKYNWSDASKECTRRGLQLAEITSAEKNSGFDVLLRTLFKKSPDLWIGASDNETGITKSGPKRPFYWSHSNRRVTLTNWAKGQPDNSGGQEHCVHIYSSTDFQWNDARCDSPKIGYVCEGRFL